MGNNAYFVKSSSPSALVYSFDTWQVCYRNIVDVHVMSLMPKNF